MTLLEKFKALQAKKKQSNTDREKVMEIFGSSLLNKPTISFDTEDKEVMEAYYEAERLSLYLNTDKIEIEKTLKYTIPTKHGKPVICQTTSFRFENDKSEVCFADFSVPMNFEGEPRLWTTTFNGKKIWTTNNNIQKVQVNRMHLFDFLGKITIRNSAEFFDDIFVGEVFK